MSTRLFPHSLAISYRDLQLEIVRSEVFRYPQLLDTIRDEVFNVAARARGWDDPTGLEQIRRTFKIGPLYAANGLVLVRREGALVGLVGTVNNWHLDGLSIVHLCSLGLLPEVQGRGLMQALFGLLWIANWQDELVQRHYHSGEVYVSAISQSPFILNFLHRFFDVFPSPYRAAPDERMVRVARHVAQRFDGHIPFDPQTFILRNECSFFYRRTPYGTDARLNSYCDDQLRYDQGDVFVIVGRVVPAKLEPFVTRMAQRHGELISVLHTSQAAPQRTLAAPSGVSEVHDVRLVS